MYLRFLPMAIALITLSWPASAQQGAIGGVLVDGNTGYPLNGKHLLVYRNGHFEAGAVVAGGGRYEVDLKPADNYEIRLRDEKGHLHAIPDVQVTANEVTPWNFAIHGEQMVATQHELPVEFGGRFKKIEENDFKAVERQRYSQFSIDVDATAYSLVRRLISQEGQLPPPYILRIEEMLNAFDYQYARPVDDAPFAIHTEVAPCPWEPKHQLVHIGIQGRDDMPKELIPGLRTRKSLQNNLVFLIDVSGSMTSVDKLPLVRQSLHMLLDNLSPTDKVGIVVYAGAAGQVLPMTSVRRRSDIDQAIDQLKAGGSTAGGRGIQLAYDMATAECKKNSNCRVVLCTDGDFNVGTRDQSELLKLVRSYEERQVYLSVLGFGIDNLNDEMMEELTNGGDGNYYYIGDTVDARRVLIEGLPGTLQAIARDVKIQVEFNEALVEQYRLIGYVNRRMTIEAFKNDATDAGELGLGHNVTALYEIVPRARPAKNPDYDYVSADDGDRASELLNLRLNYKPIHGDQVMKLAQAIRPLSGNPSPQFLLASGITTYALLLNHSRYAGSASFELAQRLITGSGTSDPQRLELLNLIAESKQLTLRASLEKATGE